MQQQAIRSVGRLDLLLADSDDGRHVIELKKGAANKAAIDQVIRYRDALNINSSGKIVSGWLLAHSIPRDVAIAATEKNIRCIELPLDVVEQIMIDHNISESDLIGPRKKCGVLYSTQGRNSSQPLMPNSAAFDGSSIELRNFIQRLESDKNFVIDSLKVQSTIFYRGIKLGGINRNRNVGYISVGIVISTHFENELFSNGFVLGHDPRGHDWYEIRLNNVKGMEAAINSALEIINRSF